MCDISKTRLLMLIFLPITFFPYIWIYLNYQNAEPHCVFESHPGFVKHFDSKDENETKAGSKISTIRRCSKNKIRPFRILMWTKWNKRVSKDDNKMFGRSTLVCDDLLPVITWNKELYDIADVVIFKETDLNADLELPTRKNESVPWILAVQEFPPNFQLKNSEDFNGMFNWIWSFRSDAEIHGRIQDMLTKRSTIDEDWVYGSNFSLEFMRQKTHMAAWVVSNCQRIRSRRNEFAFMLEKFGVNFTTYGHDTINNNCKEKFLHKPCPGEGESCFRELGRTNKFYFAFENSLCAKFMTEKLSNGIFYSMVPVYYGLAYDVKERAPPNSFIDAMEFDTTEDLAKYLIYLDKHDEEYFKYFAWRQNYTVDISDHMAVQNSYHCSIWKKMRELKESSKMHGVSHTYDRLDNWLTSFDIFELGTPCDICLKGKEIFYKHPKKNRIYFYNNVSRCREEEQEVVVTFKNADAINVEWVE